MGNIVKVIYKTQK